MLEKIRIIAKQKGQGIIEYALLLAFIVGIGMMMSGSDLGGAIKGAFDNAANLSTPEGRLAADKARIKKLGETLASKFKKSGVKDNFNKNNPAELQGTYISILVLPDGSLNVFSDNKWLTELDQTKDPYKRYAAALKDVGIDLSNSYISDTIVKNSNDKNMGKTQYYTDTNFRPYSSGDEGGLNNGYAISFTKNKNNEMELKYYSLNNPYTKEDLGTMYVPRSWLATGEGNNQPSPDGKDKYPNNLTANLSVD